MKNALTRLACLGEWIYARTFAQQCIGHAQRQVRVDLFSDWIENNSSVANAAEINSMAYANSDRTFIQEQTENRSWLQCDKPDVLFMDNFSELVDKRFAHSSGYDFCATYGEFEAQQLMSALDRCVLTDHGLLAIDSIYNEYDRFFNIIKNKWDIPIVFCHFPTKFDGREIYKKQGRVIIQAIEMMSRKYDIQSIIADDNAIIMKDGWHYHFADQTVDNMASKINVRFK